MTSLLALFFILLIKRILTIHLPVYDLALLSCLLLAVIGLICYFHKRKLHQVLQEALKDNEALFNNNPIPMWIYDRQTLHFLNVNHAATHIYGYSKEEFLSMTLKDIRAAEEVSKLEDSLNVPLKDFESGDIWEHKKKDGQVLTVQLTAHAIIFNNRNCRLVQAHDITEIFRVKEEKEAAQKDALESLNRFETLTRVSNEVIWVWDYPGDIVKWNHGLTSIFGYDKLNRDVHWFMSNVHPEDVARVKGNFDLVLLEKKRQWIEEYRFKSADGEYRDVFTRAVISYNAAEEPVSVMGSTQDVTDKRKYEKEITMLSFVARYTNNGVMITDKDGAIEWVNNAFTDLTGYTLNEVKGKKPYSFLEPGKTRESFQEEIESMTRSGKASNREALNYRKDGSGFWVRINVSPVLENNEVCSFVAVQTDITQTKFQEEKIRKQNLLLRKIAFEAAHYTRKPVANIMGLIELIDTQEVSHPEHIEVLCLLKNSVCELDHTISSIIKKTAEVERECYS